MSMPIYSLRKFKSCLLSASLIAAAMGGASMAAAAAASGGADQVVPPGFTLSRTGDMRDFDYFVGGWTAQERRLKERGVGSTGWDEFPATLCMTLYLNGQVTVDEMYMPTKKSAGLTVRGFDLHTHQ